MDLLSQYKQEHPKEFQEQKRPPATDEYGRGYSGMARIVIRLSGGRIRDSRQASYVLAIVAGTIFVMALAAFFFFSGFSSSGKARFSTECFPVPCNQKP